MSQNPEENRPVENAQPEDNHGRAKFGTGSTTQGGSNYGQGLHVRGDSSSYKQGSESNRGSNYDNEALAFGDSTTDSSNDGAQNPETGAAKEAPFQSPEDAKNATSKEQENSPQERTNLADDNLM